MIVIHGQSQSQSQPDTCELKSLKKFLLQVGYWARQYVKTLSYLSSYKTF